MTEEELGRLRQLIPESRGLAGGFTFIDPWSNMLGYSEDLGAEAWQSSALGEVVRVNPGEPGDAIHSIRSLSLAAEGIEQVVLLGGVGVFCFSCEVRSDASAAGRIALQGASQIAQTNFMTGPAWRLVRVVGEFSQPIDELRAVIEVGPGESLLVRGVELDYQATPSPYKPSYGAGGVYLGARIVEEEYVQTLRGQGWFDCDLEVKTD
ncbi:MAG: hypothetical protein IPJ98_08450 [Bryobacterales bacterium]|nr:hypothetical protein [Bryobacterales bacterium]